MGGPHAHGRLAGSVLLLSFEQTAHFPQLLQDFFELRVMRRHMSTAARTVPFDTLTRGHGRDPIGVQMNVSMRRFVPSTFHLHFLTCPYQVLKCAPLVRWQLHLGPIGEYQPIDITMSIGRKFLDQSLGVHRFLLMSRFAWAAMGPRLLDLDGLSATFNP